jgi:REP element-mobilizing transposase RayT
MPRASRILVKGHVWHLTHRCHNKDFLLSEEKTRQRWVHWLKKAVQREKIVVLSYSVTKNHVHLLVANDSDTDSIARSMQLIAGRTAQEFNKSVKRSGSFWEDRYHATAVDSLNHLHRCIAYIDLNMVRAGVVEHPSDWAYSSYREIRNPQHNNNIINHTRLLELSGIEEHAKLVALLDTTLQDSKLPVLKREPKWTEAVAVGGQEFLERFRKEVKFIGRRPSILSMDEENEVLVLTEPSVQSEFYGNAIKDVDYISGDNTVEI